MSLKFKQIEALPTRTYEKESKYDEVLDSFAKAGIPLAEIELPEKVTSDYLAAQLAKRIKARGITEFKATARMNRVFLKTVEKKPTEKKKKGKNKAETAQPTA